MVSTPDNAQTPRAPRRFRLASPGIVGLVVSALLLYWTLHDIDLSVVFDYVRDARPWCLVLSAIVATATLPLRAVRWSHTLRPESGPLPYRALYHATAIGIMANNLLPARTGELARAFAIRKLGETPFSTALSSIVIERMFDVIGLLVLLVVAIVLGGLTTGIDVAGMSLRGIVLGTTFILGTVLVGLLLLTFLPAAARSWLARVLQTVLPRSLARRALGTIDGIVSGLSALRSVRRSLIVGGWSLIIWSLNAFAIWLGLEAFNIDIGWSGPLVLQAVIALGIALPSSPGFFGPFEAALRVGLAPYGVGADHAVSFAIPFHLMTYFSPVTVLGLMSLLVSRLHLSDLPQRTAPE